MFSDSAVSVIQGLFPGVLVMMMSAGICRVDLIGLVIFAIARLTN